MRCVTALLLLLSIAPASADDDDTVRTSVIDTDIDRTPTHTMAPKYPRKARRDRIEGEVQVCFDIDRQGRPRRIAVRHSSNRVFERPSMRAVKASRFRSLNEDEELQSIKSCRTFVFSLQPASVDADSQPAKP